MSGFTAHPNPKALVPKIYHSAYLIMPTRRKRGFACASRLRGTAEAAELSVLSQRSVITVNVGTPVLHQNHTAIARERSSSFAERRLATAAQDGNRHRRRAMWGMRELPTAGVS